MITLKVGDIVRLTKGNFFTAIEEHADIYKGYVTIQATLWGGVTMGAIMFRATGQVFDSLTNNYYDDYIIPQLPLGFQLAVCECGGYKTYNSMATHYHSRWCPVNKEPEERNGYYPISWSS